MGSLNTVIWCLAYVMGLFATAIPWGGGVMVLAGVVAEAILLRLHPGRFLPKTWVIAGLIGGFAAVYLQARSPQPAQQDISRFIPDPPQIVTVYGQVDSLPRLTRQDKLQIWLQVNRLASPASESRSQPELPKTTDLKATSVGGRIYVTLPKQPFHLYPGKAIAVTGSLYMPKPALNPGGFDFQQYLAQEGSFAGLKGTSLQVLNPSQSHNWGGWMIQQRIIQAHALHLDAAEAALVSAMVLGSRVVDIPFALKESFAQVGLSHALAASGFQVSLILAVLLKLTQRCPKLVQAIVGAAGLGVFVILAGAEPAILRAVLMGLAVLVGLLSDRKVKSLQLLVLIAVILLIIFPTWIWSLSFQFSFLATLGLLVTVPALSQRLDWLPSLLIPAIAVPIAAFLWTLPLQLYQFGLVSPYSIVVNVVTTLLISVISIGGMLTAVVAIAAPAAAGWLTGWLHYPVQGLLTIVAFFSRLPGHSVAIGTISVALTLILYGLICLPWLWPKYRQQWWISGLLGMALVFIPAGYMKASQFQVTVLSAGQEPILVVQDRGKVGLIQSGNPSTVKMTLLPFLQKAGVNQIDWAIATPAAPVFAPQSEPSQGETTAAPPIAADSWRTLFEQMPVKTLYDLCQPQQPTLDSQTLQDFKIHRGKYVIPQLGQPISLGQVTVQPLSFNPTIVALHIGNTRGNTHSKTRWLWLKQTPEAAQVEPLLDQIAQHPGQGVIWWSGKSLPPKLLARWQPQVAIAYSRKLSAKTQTQIKAHQVKLYQLNQAGALQWTPDRGFQSTLELAESEPAFL